MSNVPTELKYASSHEWVRAEGNGVYTVGITEHAQELLGDMVFVDLPEVGRRVAAGEDCAVAESVKAASDIYAPISGEIVAVNGELESSRSWSTANLTVTASCSRLKPPTKANWRTCWTPRLIRPRSTSNRDHAPGLSAGAF